LKSNEKWRRRSRRKARERLNEDQKTMDGEEERRKVTKRSWIAAKGMAEEEQKEEQERLNEQ
jgi:hypothetical protein